MRLLEPIRLRDREAPNRIMFGPHVTNLGRGRAFSERHVAYYRRRAAGRCGVVVTETASVHASDWPYERAPLAADCAAGWAAIAEACRPHGPLVVASLGHTGGQGSSAYSQAPLWAPSGVPEVNTREMPKAMEQEDIDAVVAGFGAAAALAVRAGLDGVEVNAGQFSLVRQFASGLTNMRSDTYGTDRLRFAREVLHTVRAALDAATGTLSVSGAASVPGGSSDSGAASEPVLGLRFCVDELAPWAGITPEAAVGLAVELAPLVDYLVVVRGSIYSAAATRPDGHTPPGFNLPAAREVRAAVSAEAASAVPVFVQGSIVDPAMAEDALADGTADGVEMTRAQIADPELGRKLAAGHAEPVRPCILCNQTCQVQDNRNPLVTCVGEPFSGHESDDPGADDRAETAARPLEVLVVGGGPAGLECARVAAGRGHHVRVVEASERLGGSVRAAAAAPGRSRLAALVEWMEAECRRLGVLFVTGHRVDAAEVAAHAEVGPVVLCTGSVEGEREYEVEPGVRLICAAELLQRIADGEDAVDVASGSVAVWDPVGGPVGVGIAELLADRGQVTLVTPDQIPGQLLALSGDLAPANTRLQSAGVAIARRAVLRRVSAEGAEVEDRFGAGMRTIPADLVVDAGARLPQEVLARAAQAADGVCVAGDAVAPRTIAEAVREGRRAALSLGRALVSV